MELPREQQHGAINFIPKFSCSPLCRPAVRPDSDRTLALLLFLYFFGYKVAHNPTIFQTKSFLVLTADTQPRHLPPGRRLSASAEACPAVSEVPLRRGQAPA